jgi:LPXTG-motif cell wall-anchored protein
VVVGALATATLLVCSAVPASAAVQPDLARAVHYLATTTTAGGSAGTSLTNDGYYESFPGFGDFGLTMDGVFALAATGTDNVTLGKALDFIAHGKKDASGNSIDSYTGIGTEFVSGGSIAKEAVLAEVTGNDPHTFGGHDLIAALDQTVCTTMDAANGCADPGNYVFATSTFEQALGIIAQLRAGDATNAAPAIAYLESQQNAAGAWPSLLLPVSGDSDVDSTAMAAMALALLPSDATATAAVTKAEAWIASRQGADGGFTGAAGESTNSAALAIQGLHLAGSTYSSQIAKALTFLGGRQNRDGGFDVTAGGQPGSDVRATTQAVSGIVGTSFGTLSDVVKVTAVGGTTTTTTSPPPATTPTTVRASATPGTTTGGPVGTANVDATATLPRTGAVTTQSLQWATLVLVVGLGAVGISRRRRRHT